MKTPIKILTLCCLCLGITMGFGQKSKKMFKNKILIFIERNAYKDTENKKSFFIANYEDSIYKIDEPFGSFESFSTEIMDEVPPEIDTTYKTHKMLHLDLKPISAKPYNFSQRGNHIEVNFKMNGKVIHSPIYCLNTNDSLPLKFNLDNLCGDPTRIGGEGFSFRMDRDTTILLAGVKLKCWMFMEKWVQGGIHAHGSIKKIICLEKTELIPICTIEYYYNDYSFLNLRSGPYYSVLSKLVGEKFSIKKSKWSKSICN